ncbi:MAG: geranylgeranylglycerol-phosphate geranylgeranyltransferase [Candidatus Cloacimonetes bacterium]|nr:geranylgeranylglycerol-phosphate geranylgeranyltransferase [Candidatus Cloacimonadota bacterium]MBT7469603.1 geranylgeranylglycerol-phosphate geranylgeranyltransferase [Candidatus Cloacimonadota bacterium]
MIGTENIDLLPIIFATISATLIAAAGYVINDYFDFAIDKINRPNRVLPAGKITPKSAYIYSITLFTFGIFFSFFTNNIYCIFLAFINAIILFLYAKYFKLTPFFGNLIVAYIATSTFLYGAFSNANLVNIWMIATFAFLLTLIRELIKDCEDIEGDAKLKAKTLALIFGIKKTIQIAFIVATIMILFVLFLWWQAYISNSTIILLNAFVILPTLLFFASLKQNFEKNNLARISKFVKIDMLILLIILGLKI